MPIADNYTTPNTGAVATYHVVQQLTLDYVSTLTNCTVASYLSKDAKDGGKFPMYSQQIQVQGLPAAAQDPLTFAEGELIAPVPDDVNASQFTSRYAFSGGTITE
jgi:hypothetical protein